MAQQTRCRTKEEYGGHLLTLSNTSLAGARLIQQSGDPAGMVATMRIVSRMGLRHGLEVLKYPAERAGNIAGRAVGKPLGDYLGGKPSQAELTNKLKGILWQ